MARGLAAAAVCVVALLALARPTSAGSASMGACNANGYLVSWTSSRCLLNAWNDFPRIYALANFTYTPSCQNPSTDVPPTLCFDKMASLYLNTTKVSMWVDEWHQNAGCCEFWRCNNATGECIPPAAPSGAVAVGARAALAAAAAVVLALQL